MSDAVRPKRHRRRPKKSRRKKATETIESMIPGRAPLGVSNLLQQVESKKITPPKIHANVSEEHNPMTLSPQSFFATPSTPQQTPDTHPLVPSTAPETPKRGQSEAITVFQTPSSATFSPTSFRSVTHTGSFNENGRPLLKRFFSPLSIRTHRSISNMTTRRLSLVPPSRNTTPSITSLGEIHELESFDSLASSQPISLSQLCTRANTRLRPVKFARRLHTENTHNDHDDAPEDTRTTTNFREPSQSRFHSRISMIHHAKSRECGLDINREGAATPPAFYLLDNARADEMDTSELTWYREEAHYLQNPLSCPSGLDSNSVFAGTGSHGYVSGSPFLNDRAFYSEYGAWHGETDSFSPITSSVGMQPENPYSHTSVGDILPDSSFSIYTASFDRPEDRSPYESLRSRRHHYNPSDDGDLSAKIQNTFVDSQEGQHISYASPKYNTVPQSVVCRRASIMKYNAQPAEWHNPYYSSSSAKFPGSITTPHGFIARRAESDVSRRSLCSNSNGAKEEAAAFLKNMVQTSQSASEEAAGYELHRHFQSTYRSLSPSVEEDDDGDDGSSCRTNFYQAMCQNMSLTSHDELGMDVPITEGKVPSYDQPSFGGGYLYDEIVKKTMERALKNQAENLEMERCKAVQPPPGIPGPVVRCTPVGLSFLGVSPATERARIDEANSWFAKDGRGEEQLRQQVADIAENYAGRIERLQGGASSSSNSARVRQLTQLLGDVIINLHSYASQDPPNDAGNFANFGRVRSRYCEPSLGGRRSYFDRDPSMDHWRLPLASTASSPSPISDPYVSPHHMSEPDHW